MINLFHKHENLDNSPVIIGYQILKLLNQKQLSRIDIIHLTDEFIDKEWYSFKNISNGLLFLYALGIIDINDDHILINNG